MDTKHFANTAAALTWASSLPAKFKLGPFYAKDQCGLSQLEGPSPAKALGLGELWLPSYILSGHPRPHRHSSESRDAWPDLGCGRVEDAPEDYEKDLCPVCSVVPLCLLIFMFIWCKISFGIMPNWQKKKTLQELNKYFSHLLYQLFMSHPFA